MVEEAGKPGSPAVCVVIVNYNSLTDTADCLESLAAATYPNMTTVLVDNGSSDGSGRELAARFPEVTHIQLTENLGFAGGVNRGVQAALERGASFICLLNNDTLVESGFIEPLVARARSTPTAGIIGGKIFYAEPPGLLWFAGGRIDQRRGFTTHRGQDLPDSAVFSRPGFVDYITGCLFFVRAELFEQLGPLDESLFMYAEELDFCLRARRAGYRCFYEPAAVIRHRVSRAMGGAYRPVYYYYLTRNLLEVYRRHFKAARLSAVPLKLGRYLVLYQSYILTRAHRQSAGAYLCAVWLGAFDYLLGRFGRNRHRSLERP